MHMHRKMFSIYSRDSEALAQIELPVLISTRLYVNTQGRSYALKREKLCRPNSILNYIVSKTDTENYTSVVVKRPHYT